MILFAQPGFSAWLILKLPQPSFIQGKVLHMGESGRVTPKVWVAYFRISLAAFRPTSS